MANNTAMDKTIAVLTALRAGQEVLIGDYIFVYDEEDDKIGILVDVHDASKGEDYQAIHFLADNFSIQWLMNACNKMSNGDLLILTATKVLTSLNKRRDTKCAK